MPHSSVMIPTYHRSNILKETATLIYNTFNLNETKILILDGSTLTEEKEKNQSICNKFGYTYYHNDEVSLWERILIGLNIVETDIVSLLDDEDIIHHKGYDECVNFLKENKDFTICHGTYKAFNLKNELSYVNTYPQGDIDHENFLERLWSFMCPYTTPVFYAVFRTEILKKVFQELVQQNFSTKDYCSAELLLGSIPLIYGKAKKIDTFYIGRRLGNESFAPRIDYAKYLLQPNYELGYIGNSYTKIKSILFKHFDLNNFNYHSDVFDYLYVSFYSHLITTERMRPYFEQVTKGEGN